MRRSALSSPLFLALAACGAASEISVQGKVFDSYEEGSSVLPGATVVIRDDEGRVYDEARTDEGGAFEAVAPEGVTLYAEVGAQGYVSTGFTGTAGVGPVLKVERGALYALPRDVLTDWEASFDGCDRVGTGAAVIGEVRVFELVDPDTGEHPLVTTADVTLVDKHGEELPACYLNETGSAYAPSATATGGSGRFAIFGANQGLHVLKVRYEMAEGAFVYADYPVWVPEGGVVPQFPAWVEFPL